MRRTTEGRATGGRATDAARARGAMAYQAGLAAEQTVSRLYEAGGYPVAARRWRGEGGEIDLIVRNGARLIFVEVKQAASFDLAATHLLPQQISRLYAAAAEFLAGEPAGQDTESRFDVALVDGQSRVRILENALCA